MFTFAFADRHKTYIENVWMSPWYVVLQGHMQFVLKQCADIVNANKPKAFLML